MATAKYSRVSARAMGILGLGYFMVRARGIPGLVLVF